MRKESGSLWRVKSKVKLEFGALKRASSEMLSSTVTRATKENCKEWHLVELSDNTD
jgi:hypothetical protein